MLVINRRSYVPEVFLKPLFLVWLRDPEESVAQGGRSKVPWEHLLIADAEVG